MAIVSIPKINALSCKVDACDGARRANGYCTKHNQRVRKYGSIELPLRPDMATRFWEKVNKTPGLGPWGTCWEWTGCRYKGYGRFTLAGRGTSTRATRALWFLLYGRFPALDILHACDNPPCVNPAHLSEGTHAQNMAEAGERGLMPHKYNAALIRLVRLLRAYGWTYKRIAEFSSVKHNSVAQICAGRQWKHV